jgi:hypothetical protein
LISELFNNNEEILMKKFQYPILKAIFNVIDDDNIKKNTYIFSELFKNKMSILLPHIFGNDVLIGEVVLRILKLLSLKTEVANTMIENG